MNKSFLIKIVEQLLIISSLQLLFSVYFKSAVIPSFFLIWLFILTWDGNTEVALMLSFITGIIYDIISRGALGTTSIRFLAIVYITGFLRIKGTAGRFICAAFFSLIFFLSFLFEPGKGFLWDTWPLIKYSGIFVIYNGLMLILPELSIRRYRWKWKKDYLGIS